MTAIVAIGVAFFVGVTDISDCMAYSVSQYNQRTGLKDITVYSDYGFSKEDIEAINALEDVELCEGHQFADVIATSGTRSEITRIHSYDSSYKINQFVLKEGRLPENEHEALAEAGTTLKPGFGIGETVTFSRNDGDLEDYLDVEEVTIVGTIDTPLYLNMTKESSTLANQTISTYLYVPTDAFSIDDYYLEADVLIAGADEYDDFSDAYEDLAKKVKDEIETLGLTQSQSRKDTVLEEAQSEYDDGLQEYEDGVEEFNEKISDAEAELKDAEQEIEDGEQTIADNEQELIDGKQEIADAKQELTDGQATLTSEKYKGENQILDARAEISKAQSQLDEGKEEFEEKKAEYLAQKEQLQTLLDTLNKMTLTSESSLQDYLSLLTTFGQDTTSLTALLGTMYPGVSDYSTILLSDFELVLQQQITSLQTLEETLQLCIQQGYPGATPLSVLPAELQTALAQAGITEGSIDEAIVTLETNRTSLTAILTSIEGFKNIDSYPLSTFKAQLPETQATNITALQMQLSLSDETTVAQFKTAIQSAINEIDEGLASGQQTIDDAQAEINRNYELTILAAQELYEQIDEAQQEIDDGWAEIAENEQKLIDGEQELEDGKADLAQAKLDYEDGKKELEEQRADGQKELDDAKADLEEAKDTIEDLKDGGWTVLDRTSHYAMETYRSTVEQMRAIAAIFPVFFILVAVLVCLTTMTRMVSEQRTEIGTFRALGYSRFQCMRKYLNYAGLATIIGVVIGSVAGIAIFPIVIYNTWKMMYILPDMELVIPWGLIILTALIFLAVMCGVTAYVCNNDMREVPAQLLRPKVLKAGKDPLLSKIPLFWNHLSFTWKVTVRNLFRYKQRFFMTVFGVAGCCALMVTGFGISDSINTMVDTHYGEILHTDGSANLKEELSETELQSELEKMNAREEVNFAIRGTTYSAILTNPANEKDETVYAEVYNTLEDMEQCWTLRDRKSQEALTPTDDGVLISEKLSENLELSAGDTILLESEGGIEKEVVITGIFEEYIQHYVLMSETYYEETFGVASPMRTLFIQTNVEDTTALQDALAKDSSIDTMNFYDSVLTNFKNMIQGIDGVVWVLVISSMALAFVVLSNLTNVNIAERQREIATLKVLGFRKKEVESYIYRENFILTVIGALVGLPLGTWLHRTIMMEVEMTYVMFGRSALPLTYVKAFVLTVFFGIIVNKLMGKKLHDIQMVESLKSVE